MSTFQVEMLWRCSTCQTEMRGRYKKCSNCGKPKDKEPFYDAQGPVTRADAVTDPALLKQAKAGKDWHCTYCGCAERRDSGECRNCGSPSGDSIRPTARTTPPARKARTAPSSLLDDELPKIRRCSLAPYMNWILWGNVIALAVFLLWFLLSPKEVTARVAERSWTHTVHVERYQVVNDEGFHEAQPSDAFNVAFSGTRVHHHERVPDGYRSENYQERYTCGETCTTSPVRCSPNGNGFKTCSGGTRSCSPKYCSRTKYRQVQKYRDEPVYAPWYRWHVWRWRHNRDVSESGRGGETFWPASKKVALAEKERSSREAHYQADFVDTEGERHRYEPKSLNEYQSLLEGQTRRLSVGIGTVSIVREEP